MSKHVKGTKGHRANKEKKTINLHFRVQESLFYGKESFLVIPSRNTLATVYGLLNQTTVSNYEMMSELFCTHTRF